MQLLWNLWFHGDKSTKIRPYRLLHCKTDLPDRKCQGNYSKAKFMMHKLDEFKDAVSASISVDSLSDDQSILLFQSCFSKMVDFVYPDPAKRIRTAEVCYTTYYDKFHIRHGSQSILRFCRLNSSLFFR